MRRVYQSCVPKSMGSAHPLRNIDFLFDRHSGECRYINLESSVPLSAPRLFALPFARDRDREGEHSGFIRKIIGGGRWMDLGIADWPNELLMRCTGLVSRKEQEAVCCANALFRTLARSHQMTLARFETQSHGTYRSLRPLPYLSLIRKGLPCRHAFRSLRWCS